MDRPDGNKPEIPEIDVEELEICILGGMKVLDVRELEEYLETRIPGVIHIPLAELPERFSELDPSEEICVVCGKGGRSAAAIEFLQTQGFKATNVAGGTMGWIEAGKPYETG